MSALKAKKAPAKRGAGAFASRESANRYISAALEDYRLDYRKHKAMLERRLKEVGAAVLAGGGPVTALIEMETSLLANMKTLQTNYTNFLMGFVKEKGLLEGLDKREHGDGLTVIFQLPDFGRVTVVAPEGPPSEE